jgi:hypothetical protein
MSLLARFRGLSLSEVDGSIDLLDRSEPAASGWRSAFEALRSSLRRARILRWWLRLAIAPPIGVAVAILAYVWHWPNPIQTGIAAAILTFAAVGFALEHSIPILMREDRVRSLLVYFGAPGDEAYDFPISQLFLRARAPSS